METDSPTSSTIVAIAPPPHASQDVAKKPSPRITEFHRTALIRRVVCAALVVVMAYHFVGTSWKDAFQYHPLFMTVAFVGFLPEVVHLSNNFRRCRSMLERQQTLDHHFQFALAMKIISLFGFAAIEVSKIQRQKHHFTTWHGLIGVVCIVLVVVQVLVGIVYHYRLGPSKRYPNLFPMLRKLHHYMGLVLLVLAVVSMYLGMQSHFAVRAVENAVVRFLFGASVLLCVGYAYLRE